MCYAPLRPQGCNTWSNRQTVSHCDRDIWVFSRYPTLIEVKLWTNPHNLWLGMEISHSDFAILYSFLHFQNQRLCTSRAEPNPLKFRHLWFAFQGVSWSISQALMECPPMVQWGRCTELVSLCNQDQGAEGDWVNQPRSLCICLTESEIEIRIPQKVNKTSLPGICSKIFS